MRKSSDDWLGRLRGIHSCDWLDSTSSASDGSKDVEPTFGSLVWW